MRKAKLLGMVSSLNTWKRWEKIYMQISRCSCAALLWAGTFIKTWQCFITLLIQTLSAQRASAHSPMCMGCCQTSAGNEEEEKTLRTTTWMKMTGVKEKEPPDVVKSDLAEVLSRTNVIVEIGKIQHLTERFSSVENKVVHALKCFS